MQAVDDLVDDIRDREEERQQAAEQVRDAAADTVLEQDACEPDLLSTVTPQDMQDTTVTGIDGGLVKKTFHGVDIMLVRAVAAVFTYQNGKLAENLYRPSKHPQPQVAYSTESSDRGQADRLASLNRLTAEIDLATTVIDGTDMMVLDGAIAPQYADKPAEDTRLREQYEDLIATYSDLYRAAQEQDMLLAGVVEDTRSSRFCELLQANDVDADGLDSCRDSHLLHYLLDAGERTAVMPYTSSDTHTVLDDLGDHGDNLYSFYLKPVQHDRPVRIDIYAADQPVATADQIASYVYAISGAHAGYGIPAVLIEADKRAKLEQHEVDRIINRIRSKIGHVSGLSELRRDRRPF